MRPKLGVKNVDIDKYAKRLEAALYQCNLDKNNIRNWSDTDGTKAD